MRQSLCLQMNVPYIDLERVEIDQGLTRLINRTYATRRILVPVSQVGQTLTVAMNDPSDMETAEELERSTGCTIRVVTSSLKAIRKALTRLYESGAAPSIAMAPVDEIAPVDDLEVVSQEHDALADREYSQQSRRADELVRQIFGLAIGQGASDVHLEALARNRLYIRFRIDGMLRELDMDSLQQACNENVAAIASRIKILGKLDIAERRRPQDGSFQFRTQGPNGERLEFDLRISIMPSYHGESIVVRILDRRRAPRSIDSLGFPAALSAQFRKLLHRPSGIVLITGPTGSGKSTTMHAALKTIYRPEIRIVTAEDPIEYVYEQFSQSEVNEHIGNTFAHYLRAFLRHDPEVIMVGEIRDQETAEMAFRAAMTGHLLISTLHTSDAVSAVSRLLDMQVEPTLITSSLAGVLAQRLVRTLCLKCREEHRPPDDLLREFFGEPYTGLRYYRGRGCADCNYTGYRGRRLVAELWTPNDHDVILINKGAPKDDLIVSAAASTYSMAESALRLLEEGLTNPEELMRMMPYSAIARMRDLVPQ
jgi:type IV pilus assembly protein PilB